MKELFYSGRTLQKDLEFCDIMFELEKNPNVLLLSYPEKFVVHHMIPGMCGYTDKDSGETHMGYESHYVTFLYGDYIFYIQSAMYYPFVDDNYPGRFNFMAFKRVDMDKRIQCSYYEEYENMGSIDKWILHKRERRIQDVVARRIDLHIGANYTNRICIMVDRYGGAREKAVINSFPVFLRAETWNDEHKVVHVIAGNKGSELTTDVDGHRYSFDFDLVTNKICG